MKDAIPIELEVEVLGDCVLLKRPNYDEDWFIKVIPSQVQLWVKQKEGHLVTTHNSITDACYHILEKRATSMKPENLNQPPETELNAGLCWKRSDPSLGWTIRRIMRADGDTVELNDRISFSSPCFAGAHAGDIWVVYHEAGIACFGQVRRAFLLEPVRHAHPHPHL